MASETSLERLQSPGRSCCSARTSKARTMRLVRWGSWCGVCARGGPSLNADPAVRGAAEIATWCDEEECYFAWSPGSRSFVGELTEAEIDAGRNRAGTPLRQALAEAGLAGRPRARIEPDSISAASKRILTRVARGTAKARGRRNDFHRRHVTVPHHVPRRREPHRVRAWLTERMRAPHWFDSLLP